MPSRFLLSEPAAQAVSELVRANGGFRLVPRRIAPPSGGGSGECVPAVVQSFDPDTGLYTVSLHPGGIGSAAASGGPHRLATTERSPAAALPVGAVVLAHRVAILAGDDGSDAGGGTP